MSIILGYKRGRRGWLTRKKNSDEERGHHILQELSCGNHPFRTSG